MDHLRNIARLSLPGLAAPVKKTRGGPRNERDELFDFFYAKLARVWKGKRPLTKPYFAMRIAHLSVKDLYYIKSICTDAERNGRPFSMVFWGSLKPRPEEAL